MGKVKRIIVWRWAEPSKKFLPTKNLSWRDLKLKTHDRVVFAALKPTYWMWLGRTRTGVLHKIELTEEQASQCVVAEQEFRPTDEEMNEYLNRTGRRKGGSIRAYSREHYEKSFIPLLDYKGGYILPEVLIPFDVEAKPCKVKTWWLKFKKRYFSPELGEYPSRYKTVNTRRDTP